MLPIGINKELWCGTFVVMHRVIMTDGMTVSDQVGLGLTATEEHSFIQDHASWIIRKLHHPAHTKLLLICNDLFLINFFSLTVSVHLLLPDHNFAIVCQHVSISLI